MSTPLTHQQTANIRALSNLARHAASLHQATRQMSDLTTILNTEVRDGAINDITFTASKIAKTAENITVTTGMVRGMAHTLQALDMIPLEFVLRAQAGDETAAVDYGQQLRHQEATA